MSGAIFVEWGFICDQFGFSSMFGPLIAVNVLIQYIECLP